MSENAWSGEAESIVGLAIQAPSSHNTQPWLFRLSAAAIELYADRTRALPVNDPHDRELTISCGCALMNLRIAAAEKGWACAVELLPQRAEPDLLARVSLLGQLAEPAEESVLAAFIRRRRTYRKRFAPEAVTAPVIDRLLEAARREGARFTPLVADHVRHQAADLVAAGDAEQWDDPSWRRELAAWMHPRRQGDGLAVPALAAPVAQLVVRTFDMGGGVGAKDRELAQASPLLAVLSTDADTPHDWLLAGQALQRTLLVACQQGLQASYLNQPIQVASLRPKLQDLAGAGLPQILLRLGYPSEQLQPTPRRPPQAVITA